MGKRREVIFVVEGKSDKIALNQIFDDLFDVYYQGAFDVQFVITHGDITTAKNVNPRNIIETLLEDHVNKVVEYGNLMVEDIAAILQIVDLDGAYVSNDRIKEVEGLEKTIYNDYIETDSKYKIIRRNKQKAENLDFLVASGRVGLRPDEKNIRYVPYQCFYFSTNIDHFLYDGQNLTNEEKKAKSSLYGLKPFEEFECDVDEEGDLYPYLADTDDYQQSWKYVKGENRSLTRLSNINILVREIQHEFFEKLIATK